MELKGSYPRSWAEFVGQPEAKEQLRLAARSARARKAVADHTLFASPEQGVGKTSLALLFAKELRSDIVVAPPTTSAEQALFRIEEMNDGDVFFIDEIHKVFDGGKAKGEWLLQAMQDGVIPQRGRLRPIPEVVFVAATTDVEKLPLPVRDRFARRPPIVPYTPAEATRIARVTARRLLGDAPVHASTLGQVAAAANNNPREIGNLLKILRDLVTTRKVKPGPGGRYDLALVFRYQGVTPDGLNQTAQDYLLAVRNQFHNGPVGERTIRDTLGVVNVVQVERLLVRKGLLSKEAGGRKLTAAGIQRARELAA
jgi:Holliday junction DNA helicase RuvB